MGRLKRLFSPGLIVAVCAMVLALGGTAVADHLITGDQIARNTITGLNITNESIRGGDIQDGTITSKQINPSTLRALLNSNVVQTPSETRPGTQGAQGEQGERGPEGQRGPAGPRGQDAEARVTALPGGGFDVTNESVSMTGDGVEFGPYANGGEQGGSLHYDGLDGQALSAVKSLIYEARYTATGDTGGVGVPYLRIFTENGDADDHSIVFSPNTQPPDPDVAEGPFHTWAATSGLWRYDDDAGAGGEFGLNGAPFSDVLGPHGEEIITGIYITTGFSAGADLSSLLTTLSVNGERFRFGG